MSCASTPHLSSAFPRGDSWMTVLNEAFKGDCIQLEPSFPVKARVGTPLMAMDHCDQTTVPSEFWSATSMQERVHGVLSTGFPAGISENTCSRSHSCAFHFHISQPPALPWPAPHVQFFPKTFDGYHWQRESVTDGSSMLIHPPITILGTPPSDCAVMLMTAQSIPLKNAAAVSTPTFLGNEYFPCYVASLQEREVPMSPAMSDEPWPHTVFDGSSHLRNSELTARCRLSHPDCTTGSIPSFQNVSPIVPTPPWRVTSMPGCTSAGVAHFSCWRNTRDGSWIPLKMH